VAPDLFHWLPFLAPRSRAKIRFLCSARPSVLRQIHHTGRSLGIESQRQVFLSPSCAPVFGSSFSARWLRLGLCSQLPVDSPPADSFCQVPTTRTASLILLYLGFSFRYIDPCYRSACFESCSTFPRSISYSVAALALRSSLPEQLQGFIFVSIWLSFVF
jgi:hypothetical protein